MSAPNQTIDLSTLVLFPILIGVVVSLAGMFFKRFSITSEGILTGKIRLDAVVTKVDTMGKEFTQAIESLQEISKKIELYEYRMNAMESKLDKLLNQTK